MTKENFRLKNVKNKKTMILAFFLAIAVVIAGVGFSTVRVHAGDTYINWDELSDLKQFNKSPTVDTPTTVELKGKYKVTKDTTITATASGVSAITIKGETHLYIADGVTLTVTGANGEGTVGGGAGICLPSGKTLHIYGEGKLVATGGSSGNATTGSAAESAKIEDGTLTTGAGGAGGNGAGSAGAGIGGSGVNGGNGGAGGESQTASKTANSNGIDGTDGQSGAKGNAMGTLYLYDTLTIQAKAGTTNNDTINAGANNQEPLSNTDNTMSYMAFASAGGGAGGNSGISANIGGSGAGGNGGGGGASGGYIIAEGTDLGIQTSNPTPAESSKYEEKKTAGGNGGNSGSGRYTDEIVSNAGTGGAGGSVSTGGTGGTVYRSAGVTLENELSGGINEFEGKKAVQHTLGILTAKACYYDEKEGKYVEGIIGGTVASGVHEPDASVTANTKKDSSLAEVTAEPKEGYSFAGWYSTSEESRNLLSGELDYTEDFSKIESGTQTVYVYALFKKATQITAENGTLTVYKGITEENQEGLSKLVIPRDTVVTINGNRKTLKQGGVYYYQEAVTANESAGLSTYPGEELLFYSKPAENYFYSGMTIDNDYKSAREFAQYSFVTVGEEFPKTYTSLFSSAKTLTLNFEGGVEVDYNEPIKFDMADMEYKLPQTIRIGYNFLGWQLNSENPPEDYIPAGSIVRYKENSEDKNNMQLAVYTYDENGIETCVYTTTAEDGIGFSAKWDTKTYPITLVMPADVTIQQFEDVEMVEGVYNYTYDENENAMIQLPTAEDMVYAGHDFLGWYLYDDYSGKSVTEFSSHSTNAPTFYAKWGKQFKATLTLEGAPIVGQTLSATADSNDKNITFTYAWYRNGVLIAGENTASYTLCSEDEGCVIKCIATGSGDYTPNMSISCSTEKISIKTGNTLTGLTISGIAQSGKTLTASILPTTAENVTYQWYRVMPNADESGTLVETAIDGANSSTYKLTEEDVGFALKCIAMDGYGNRCSFTTPVISKTSTVKLVVTEQAKVACGSGTSIKVDTQDMTANSSITITIPEGLELVKYPDKNDRTIGAFISSVEKTNNDNGTVTLTYYFEKKTNVLGFSITVKPDYTNTHGSVKQITTTYSNVDGVSIVGETTIHITNVTAQPGSGYIYPVTDKEVYYQVRDEIFHIYNPALFVNTTVTSAHPSYQEVSMVVPISSSKYIPIPVFYDEDKKTSKELIDGQTYQMKDGDEEYTVTYYENYAVKNGSAEKATYTGPVLVYTLPEKSGICKGESSEYRFNGEYTDGSKLALKFNEPEPGKYLPEYKEQINIKDDNGAKTTVYNTGSRSNHTSLEIIFYEKGTDSLYLSTDITSLGYSHMVNNILVPYQYSNRYSAYLTYYSKENLITDMNIHYNLEEQNANNNSTLGCNEVTFCYPDTFKKGTTYQATITFEDGSSKTTSVYNSQQTFKSTNGKQIIAVDVHYQNEAENGGILRGASAELLYCNIYNEQNLQPEAEGKITATITEITYVGEASNQQVEKKENVRTHSIAYHFQHTDTFTAAVPTINPSAIEIGDTITIQYTFGDGTTPGATYSPETYMIMPKGYIYQKGSYQKNANSSYKASSVESKDISSFYTTDGVFKESTNQLLETGYATDGSKMYEILGRSMKIGDIDYNVYSILYYDDTIRAGYKTLGMDFVVGDYISMPDKNSNNQVTLPYAIYFDNGETAYQTEKKSAFIASYKKDSNTYYISEDSVGYDINGDNDKLDSFAKPSGMPQAALNVSYVMVIDGKTDKAFYKVNEEGHYTAVIFNRTSDNTGQAEITIDLARNVDAGSEFNMILSGAVTLEGGDIGELNENEYEYVKYCIPDNGTPKYYTKTEIENDPNDALSYDKVTQLKITCSDLKTGNLNTISFYFTPKNIVTGQDEIAGAYVPTSVSYKNSSTETGSESYKTTVPCEIEAARLKLTGISIEESNYEDKDSDIYYVGDKLTAINPESELSEKNNTDTDDEATFTYQWYRDGKPINGATSKDYTLTKEDYGHTVYCMITGTGDYYSSVKTKEIEKIAVDLEDDYTPDPYITISGNTVLNNKAVDRTLTANLDEDKYPSNIAVTYKWYRRATENDEWTEIKDATSKTYTLTNEDWRKQLTVKAFGKEEKYAYVETGYSAPFGPITTRKTYVYVKQDGKLSDAKGNGNITLVNETLTYELTKTSNGTYCVENIQPGKYKVLADDPAYPNKADTGLTVSVGTDISSQSTTINYYSIQYELIDEKAVIAGNKVTDYPIYYRKNQGVTLPTEVSLTNEDYGQDEFLGWYLDDHYTSSKQTAVKGTENKAMTYYAKWKYTHPIFYQLKNVTASNMQNTIWDKTTYSTTLTAIDEYYEITEDTIKVKVDGRILESNEYKYTKNTGTQQDSGTLEILSENVTGVIDIIVSAEAKKFSITRDLEHITSNKSDVKEIKYGTDYTETLTVDAGYTTPSEITVMRGTEILDPSKYTVTMSGRNIKVTVPGTEITDDIEIIAKAVKVGAESHTLTIGYVYENGEHLEGIDTVVKTLEEGDSYSVASPSVEGYVPDLSRVSGTMDTVDVTVTVVYRPENKANLPSGSPNDEQTGEDDKWVSDTEEDYKDATTNILVTVKHQDEGTLVEGITTYAYQILSIQTRNEEGYKYAINTYYQNFFNTLLGKETASDKNVLDYLETLNTNEKINAFLEKIQEYTLEEENKVSYVAKETGKLGSTQFTLDCSRRYSEDDRYYAGMGYYFFVSEGTLGDQMTLSLVKRDMTVYIKSQEVTLEKEVEKPDYPMNSNTIQYTITVPVPNMTNVLPGYTYNVHDIVDKGITIDKDSLKVYAYERFYEENAIELIVEDDYQVAYGTEDEKEALTITFHFDSGNKLKDNQQNGKLIKIVYTASLNKGAVLGGNGNQNIAYLEYSRNPYSNITKLEKTEEDKETVYTYGIDIIKKSGALFSAPVLPGAEFTIKELTNSGAEILSFKNIGGKYYKSDEGTIQTMVTDADGMLQLYGLDAGIYMIEETKAPEGYQTIDPFYLEIRAEYNEEGILKSFSGKLTDTKGFVNITKTSKEKGILSLKIVDPTEGTNELPATGGIGRIIIYCLGGTFMVGAILLLTLRAKKEEDADEE